MNIVKAPTCSIRIYMAGNIAMAEQICREFCYEVGECVTVTPTRYVYKGGDEAGFIVGFINYPRFARTPEQLVAAAQALATKLMTGLFQSSYTIETPEETTWYSRREAA